MNDRDSTTEDGASAILDGFSTAKPRSLSQQDHLIRRALVRRILTDAWSEKKQITGPTMVRNILEVTFKVKTDEATTRRDFRVLGVLKMKGGTARGVTYVIPAYNPEMDELRHRLDPKIVEHEVSQRLLNYGLDVAISQQMVIIMMDKFCGKMAGEWISMLSWPEIIHVMSFDHSAVILCADAKHAKVVRARLIGDQPIRMSTGRKKVPT